MRAMKLAVAVVAGLAISRYIGVYYQTTKFETFLNEQIRKRSKWDLKHTLVSQAAIYSLPIREEDISIATMGSVYRVVVDYHVPVNLFLFHHVLSFHAAAAGFSSE